MRYETLANVHAGSLRLAEGDADAALPGRIWQPRNNWRPGMTDEFDSIAHAQRAMEQVERQMQNLKMLLGTSGPDEDEHRAA